MHRDELAGMHSVGLRWEQGQGIPAPTGSVTLGVTLSVTLCVTVTVPVRVSDRDSPSQLVTGVTGSAAVVVMGCTRWTLSTATCAARLSPSSSSTAILADHNSLTSQP